MDDPQAWANALRKAVSDSDRLNALFRLSQMGFKAKPAIGAVVEQIEHDNEMIRKAATNTLWYIHREGVDVLGHIRAVLLDIYSNAKPRTAVALEVIEFRSALSSGNLWWLPGDVGA